MASSLRIGIQAVAGEMDGALILLGDMPLVSSAQINQLITGFDPATGAGYCCALQGWPAGQSGVVVDALFPGIESAHWRHRRQGIDNRKYR